MLRGPDSFFALLGSQQRVGLVLNHQWRPAPLSFGGRIFRLALCVRTARLDQRIECGLV